MYGPNRDQPEPGAYEVVHGHPCKCGKTRVHGFPVLEQLGHRLFMSHTRHSCGSPEP